MKIIVLILLALIVIALFTGLYFLMKDPSRSKNTLRSLMVRVGFTLILLVLLLVSIYMGWLVPHPVGQ